jgi:hypothetical protein
MTLAHAAVRSARRGLSILEFLAGFSALSAGVVLGSLYLGVNVKEMAYLALERAHIVDPRPTSAETADAVANSATPAPGSPTELQQSVVAGAAATTVAGEPLTPSTPASASAPANAAVPPANHQPAPDAAPAMDAETATATLPEPVAGLFAREDLITPEQRYALTLAYWEALGACMRGEVDHRVPAIDAEGNWQLFDYLTGRKDGHLNAAAAIAALDARGVDDHVLAYAKKARAWHIDGAKLFGRAVDLLTDAPTAQLSGPFAQSWQSAATQHRMEARLLEEKQLAVRSYLDHAYQAPPATAAAPAAHLEPAAVAAPALPGAATP